MAKLGRELKAKGVNVVDLSLGEPDFRVPEHINEAAIKAVQDGYSKYPPVAGYPDLLEAISNKLKRDNGLDFAPNQVIVSTGAKQSLANAFMCLIDPGDEVIIPTPFWVTYATLAQMAGGNVHYIHCGIDDNFKLTPERLEAAITDKTRLFIFSSPCNPSGSVYSLAELEGLAQVFERHPNVFIISDEIYEYINFAGGHQSIAQFPALKDRVAVVNGMSKGFAMTGWRLGYLAGPRPLVQACEKYQSQITSGANTIAQKAAVAALNSDLTPTMEMTKAYHVRRDYVVGRLQDIKGIKANVPEGAFYAFPDISYFFGKTLNGHKIDDDSDMAMYLLNEAHVSTVCGSAFGNNDCIRLSFATSMELLEEAMNRIEAALKVEEAASVG